MGPVHEVVFKSLDNYMSLRHCMFRQLHEPRNALRGHTEIWGQILLLCQRWPTYKWAATYIHIIVSVISGLLLLKVSRSESTALSIRPSTTCWRQEAARWLLLDCLQQQQWGQLKPDRSSGERKKGKPPAAQMEKPKHGQAAIQKT